MPRITRIDPIENSALERGLAEKIFDQIARFAGYGFNKSHAAAYADLSYKTALLKTHHPAAFLAAAANQTREDVARNAIFVQEMRNRSIPVARPSINSSTDRFTPFVTKGTTAVHYGLSAIRGVGSDAALAISLERAQHGPFTDFEDFRTRLGEKINRTALVGLAKSGAFDCLKMSRAEALARAQARYQRSHENQMDMFASLAAAPEITIEPLTRDQWLDNELYALGHYMSDHPLRPMQDRLFEEQLAFGARLLRAKTPPRKADLLAVVTSKKLQRTNAGQLMLSVQLSDPVGMYEIVAFGDTVSEIQACMTPNARVIVECDIARGEVENRFFVTAAETWSDDVPEEIIAA